MSISVNSNNKSGFLSTLRKYVNKTKLITKKALKGVVYNYLRSGLAPSCPGVNLPSEGKK